MEELIRIELNFNRKNEKREISEEYTNVFIHSDENSYDAILEKIQLMLQAMGYEFGNKIIMAVDPSELVSDITPAPTNRFTVVRNPDDE